MQQISFSTNFFARGQVLSMKKADSVDNGKAPICSKCCWLSTRVQPHFPDFERTTLVISVKSRIELKILILTFTVYHKIGPRYLSDSLIKYVPKRTLRSANKNLLVDLMYNLESYGKCAFSVITPLLWNNLPDEMRSTTWLREELRPFYSRTCIKRSPSGNG